MTGYSTTAKLTAAAGISLLLLVLVTAADVLGAAFSRSVARRRVCQPPPEALPRLLAWAGKRLRPRLGSSPGKWLPAGPRPFAPSGAGFPWASPAHGRFTGTNLIQTMPGPHPAPPGSPGPGAACLYRQGRGSRCFLTWRRKTEGRGSQERCRTLPAAAREKGYRMPVRRRRLSTMRQILLSQVAAPHYASHRYEITKPGTAGCNEADVQGV